MPLPINGTCAAPASFAARAGDVYEHALQRAPSTPRRRPCFLRLRLAGPGELAHQENKRVEFRAEGLETQADRFRSPNPEAIRCCTWLRNAVLARRRARRRSVSLPANLLINTIEVRIAARGERLLLTVADDGRGVDSRAIVQEAVRRGFLSDPY